MKSEIGSVNAKVDELKSDIVEIKSMLRQLSPSTRLRSLPVVRE